MVTENNFKNWIILLPILGVLCTSILLTYLFMEKIHSNYNKEIQVVTEHKKELLKVNIKNRIDTLCKIIDQNFQVDDHAFEEIIFTKNQQLLNETRFNNDDYIFAYDLKGNTIAHANKNLIGTNRIHLKVNNRYLVKEFIENPNLKEGFFISYTASYTPKKNQTREKISYVRSPKYVDWVIGTGIYIDDYNSELMSIKNQIRNELQETLNMVILISIVVTIIGLIIMSYLSNSIFSIIHNYQKKLLEKNQSLEAKVEQRVKEQNSIMQLFDNADAVLYKWEYKNHQFKYISKNIEKILGYSQEQLMKQSFIYTKFILKDDVQKYVEENKEAIHLGLTYYEHSPYRLVSKNSSVKWIREYKLLIKNEKGKVTHVIGYFTDITHLKTQEQMVSKSQKTLALKELLHNLAHQWRQPLSVISTAASGMKLQNELNLLNNELIEEYTQHIISQTKYLSNTIDGINAISIDRDKHSLLNMNSVMNKVEELISQDIKEKNIELIVNVHIDREFEFHEKSLLQLLLHILTNSIEALQTQEQFKVIFVDIYTKSEYLIIKIQDSAGGINPPDIHKVFEPYFTTKHQSLGTGLGLNICQNILEMCDGHLNIENQTFKYQGNQLYGLQVSIKIPIS